MDELKKLEAIIEKANVPSTEEVAELIAQIIQAIQEAQAHMEKMMMEHKMQMNSAMNRSFEEAIKRLDDFNKELEKKADLILENVQKNVKIDIDGITKGLYKELQKLKDLIPPPADFTDVLNKISEIEKRIPTLPDEITGERVIEKINESEGKIERERVEGLDEELIAIRKLPRGGGINRGSLRGAPFSFSGDGVTTQFYLPTEPIGKSWFIFAHMEGQWLQKDVHYTVSGKLFNTAGGSATFTAPTGSVIEGFVMY